jgi:hypothetical protein
MSPADEKAFFLGVENLLNDIASLESGETELSMELERPGGLRDKIKNRRKLSKVEIQRLSR